MRFEGILKSWNNERGFGFIEPFQGGEALFVHIKAFEAERGRRPAVGQRVTFEEEVTSEGKRRARRVQYIQLQQAQKPQRRRFSAQRGRTGLFAFLVFILIYVTVQLIWHVPDWVAGLYFGASVITFIFYAADKWYAISGRWRISEGTLILLGLAGGWPGAIVAQELLRHKSIKAEFRAAFWGSALLNVLGFVGLCSPFVQTFLT